MLQSFHYFFSINRKFSTVVRPFSMSSIKTVLIDISGTLHVQTKEIPGSVAALNRLREADVDIKFVTNTSAMSSKALHDELIKIGFTLSINEMYSSLVATRYFLEKENFKPLLLLEDDSIKGDFPGFGSFDGNPDAVVVGLAPALLNRATLNKALRILLNGGTLIAVNQAKYMRTNNGLSLAPGCFVKALEYGSGSKAITLGKPNADFFKGALDNVRPEEAVMIGDDVKDDIFGAQILGMRGYLVKTGKYLEGDENKINPPPYKVVDSFADAVDDIISLLKK